MIEKKNITIVTSYPFPGFAATSNRILSFAKELSNVPKFSVTVVGPGPDNIFELNYKKINYKIHNVNTIPYSGRNLFKRAFSEFVSAQRLLKSALKIRTDVLIISIPSIFLLLFFIFKKNRIKTVLDIRDLVWEYFISKKILYKIPGVILKRIITIITKKSDIVTVTNESEYSSLKKCGILSEIIYNGVDQDRFKKLSKKNVNIKNREDKKINLTYAGNIGLAQKLEILIKASGNVKNLNVNIIGKGKDSKRLKEIVKKNNINNINIIDAMSFDSIVEYYIKTDIFYVQIGNEFSTALPSKIFEFIATGKSLILSVPDGPARNLATNFNGIHIVEPENIDLLKNKLLSISLNEIKYNKQNVDLIRAKFLREMQAKKLIKIIENKLS